MSAVNPSPERAAAGPKALQQVMSCRTPWSSPACDQTSAGDGLARLPLSGWCQDRDENWEIVCTRTITGFVWARTIARGVRPGSDIDRKVVRALTGLGEGYVLLPPTQFGLASDAPKRPGPVGIRVDVAVVLSRLRDALRHPTAATLRCIVAVALRTKISILFCQLIANTRRCSDRQRAIRSSGP
jgi:hypothetical protein